MNIKNHDTIVGTQFGSRAHAYLTSSVHATGNDLEQLVQLIENRPDAIALDMGCGGGHVAFNLASRVKKVVAYDLSEAMLTVVAEEAKRRKIDNLITKQGSAEHLSESSDSFDIVVSRYSTHHWSDLLAGLVQMRRVLKPNGLAVFMDVISPGVPLLDTWLQTLELLRDASHVKNYSLSEWQYILASAGFISGLTMRFRLRLEFAAWVERMKTPSVHVQAIQSLLSCAGSEVTEYFAIEQDGSFTVDTMLISARVK